MTKTFKLALLLCSFIFIVFYSCNKSSDSPSTNSSNTETTTSLDYAFAQTTNDDAASVSSQIEDDRLSGSVSGSGSITSPADGLLLGSCATVSIDTVAKPHTLTIDFGTTNCLCFDGKYRRGKIVVSFTGRYRDSASSHTIAFSNYYVNDYKVEGSQTVVNQGHNSKGNLSFAIQTNSTITDTTGKQFTFTSTRTREWIGGESTAGWHGWSDDVYSITGTASGTGFNGTSFTASITNPLIIALNCQWIEQGTITFTPSGKLTRKIDFGDGTCDSKATVAIAGVTFPITLR